MSQGVPLLHPLHWSPTTWLWFFQVTLTIDWEWDIYANELNSWEKMKYKTGNNFKSNRTLNNQIFKHELELWNVTQIKLQSFWKEIKGEYKLWNFSMLSERALYVKERRRRRSEEVEKIIKSTIMILHETTF